MNTSKLLEYLSICIDLEKHKYSQKNVIQQIDKKIKVYNDKIKSNEKLNIKSSDIGNRKVEKHREYGCLSLFSFYLGICLIIASLALGKETSNPLISVIGIVLVVLICYIVPISAANIKAVQARDREEAALRHSAEIANVAISKRNIENAEIQNSIIPKYEAEKRTMQETYQLTCQALQKCYDTNIIPAKYRSIIPICMFYDYILNGRTYSLKKNPQTFDEGAINMYEEECFKEIILHKFDIIIDGLDRIAENQKILYNTLQESNKETRKLLSGINSNISKANSNIQTIQYQNEQRNKCLEYMSYVTYQRYMS